MDAIRFTSPNKRMELTLSRHLSKKKVRRLQSTKAIGRLPIRLITIRISPRSGVDDGGSVDLISITYQNIIYAHI